MNPRSGAPAPSPPLALFSSPTRSPRNDRPTGDPSDDALEPRMRAADRDGPIPGGSGSPVANTGIALWSGGARECRRARFDTGVFARLLEKNYLAAATERGRFRASRDLAFKHFLAMNGKKPDAKAAGAAGRCCRSFAATDSRPAQIPPAAPLRRNLATVGVTLLADSDGCGTNSRECAGRIRRAQTFDWGSSVAELWRRRTGAGSSEAAADGRPPARSVPRGAPAHRRDVAGPGKSKKIRDLFAAFLRSQ